MKRKILITIAMAMVIALEGCGAISESKSPDRKDSTITISESSDIVESGQTQQENRTGELLNIEIASRNDEQFVDLSFEDASKIGEILENGTWNEEGTADCFNDCLIIFNGLKMYYHSACGTFNDNVNQKCLSLDESMKEDINGIFEKYITLETDVAF